MVSFTSGEDGVMRDELVEMSGSVLLNPRCIGLQLGSFVHFSFYFHVPPNICYQNQYYFNYSPNVRPKYEFLQTMKLYLIDNEILRVITPANKIK